MSDHDEGPVQILTLDGEGTEPVQLLLENLDSISKALEKERCEYVSIISVMGTYRTGKSFLLDLLMRYLRTRARRENRLEDDDGAATPQTQDKPKPTWCVGTTLTSAELPPPDWIREGDARRISEGAQGTSDSRGFGWRGGSEKCTNGIWLWRKPFVLHDLKGRRIGVLLMDTQGAWDGKMSKDQSATIFGLTALLSSKLIYNIQNRIEEDKLDNLDYFTSFAEKACGNTQSDKPPFGHLELLIRDWPNYEDTWNEGQCKQNMEQHLSEHLDPRKVPDDAKDKVMRLRKCFNKIDCFGLPFPGQAVTKPKYKGDIDEIDIDFLHMLDSFTEIFFSDGFPSASAPLGCELTAKAFSQTVRNFVEAFATSRGMALGLRDAFVQVQMMQELQNLVKKYKLTLEERYPDSFVSDQAVMRKEMDDLKEQFQKEMLSKLHPFKLKEDQEKQFMGKLNEEIEEKNTRRLNSNETVVEGAVVKVVASPFVGCGAYLAATFALGHTCFLGAAVLLGSWVQMKKHSGKNNTEMLHPSVFTGMWEDCKRWSMKRYKDVQAMQVVFNNMESNKIVETFVGPTMKAAKAMQVGMAVSNAAGDTGVEMTEKKLR
jgi:atlastin